MILVVVSNTNIGKDVYLLPFLRVNREVSERKYSERKISDCPTFVTPPLYCTEVVDLSYYLDDIFRKEGFGNLEKRV